MEILIQKMGKVIKKIRLKKWGGGFCFIVDAVKRIPSHSQRDQETKPNQTNKTLLFYLFILTTQSRNCRSTSIFPTIQFSFLFKVIFCFF